jgi:hypothetical protein
MSPVSTRIRPRERDAVIQSLRAGVVPRAGKHTSRLAVPRRSKRSSPTSHASPMAVQEAAS